MIGIADCKVKSVFFFYAIPFLLYRHAIFVKKRERVIGVNSISKVTKNKLTGKVREINIPIYYDYGIDDIGANIDFLVAEDHWKKTKQTITVPEWDYQGTRDTIIRNIERYFKEEDLQLLVGDVWKQIEEDIRLNRKKRY